MELEELVRKNRSYRRFYGEKDLKIDQLKELVAIARLTPSAGNLQQIRYKLVCDRETNTKIYDQLGWAGYLKDWDGPIESERPSGYIIMATDIKANATIDEGIAGQTLLLKAVEMGLGGCFLGNVKREEVAKIIGLPETMKVDYVIAIGYPKEKIVLEDISVDESIKYYRDEDQTHHVPKINLDDIILLSTKSN